MELFNTLVLFFIGFFILIKGANYLVSGSISIAQHFKVSTWFIGIVIVSIGTSIPELAVNIAAVFDGNVIGLETIIGGTTFNVLFILGLIALFHPVIFKKKWITRDLLLNIGIILLTAAFILLPILGEADFVGVSRPEGQILLGLFFLWIIFMFNTRETTETDADYKVFTLLVSFGLIIVGIVGVFFGGNWVVDGALEIALAIGVSPALVALTVVAIGTSLPELTVSIVALMKKHYGIAVGNVIGSNIFGFLGIIGISSTINKIPVEGVVRFDIFAALGASVVLFVLMFVGKRFELSRGKGLIMLLVYVLSLVYIFMRG